MTGALVRITQPKKIYVFWSKLLGGTMWFWILWRFKHDWPDVVVGILDLDLVIWCQIHM